MGRQFMSSVTQSAPDLCIGEYEWTTYRRPRTVPSDCCPAPVPDEYAFAIYTSTISAGSIFWIPLNSFDLSKYQRSQASCILIQRPALVPR